MIDITNITEKKKAVLETVLCQTRKDSETAEFQNGATWWAFRPSVPEKLRVEIRAFFAH